MIPLIITMMEDEDDKSFMLELYKNYYGLVRKTIYSVIHNQKDMEDLINDTFIRIIEKLSLIRTLSSCKIAAYIVYTSKSVAINFIKHRDVQNKHLFLGLDDDLSQNLSSPEDIVEDRIIYEQEIESLSDAILELPEKQKNLLYFKYILEMNDEEIAKNLGIAPDSVREYLTRARRKAKSLIGKDLREEMKFHAK